jgi:lactoylglutathione lyase
VAVSVVAYLIGVATVPMARVLTEFVGDLLRRTPLAHRTPGHWRGTAARGVLTVAVAERLAGRLRTDDKLRSAAVAALRTVATDEQPADCARLEQLVLVNGYQRSQIVHAVVDVAPLVDDIQEDLFFAAQRLPGKARGQRSTVQSLGTVAGVKTLHTAYRITDLASLGFYAKLGYIEVGRTDIGDGASLIVLKFSGEEVGTLELVHRPADDPVDIGTGFSHLVVQVDDLGATIETLSRVGSRPGPVERPGGPGGPQTSWLTDPDGYRIELVQWPPGHPDGVTAADFD